jgi:hypothetical protein
MEGPMLTALSFIATLIVSGLVGVATYIAFGWWGMPLGLVASYVIGAGFAALEEMYG